MSKRNLPQAPLGRFSNSVSSAIAPSAFDRWNSSIQAANVEDDRTISIYDVIGEDWWTGEGVTAKRISAALRSIGKGDVTVNINSPGGDVFEGLAIYNLLREHQGEITVNIMGLAASAASFIAMAGDTVNIARAGFLMVHNSWLVAMGNRHDLRDVAEWLEPFDETMADIYAARTGQDIKAIQKLMDAESWINGTNAIDQGFADSYLPSDQVGIGEELTSATAVRRLEAALRASGMPKGQAQKLISEFKSSVRDSLGSGARDVPERDSIDPKAINETVAFATSLTSILKD